MKKILSCLTLLVLIQSLACAQKPKAGSSSKAPCKANPGEALVKMVTDSGTIILKLFSETPQHRDNFVKLVQDHFYDSTLFHRVINNFMIQGGDPDSKHAYPGVMLGNGGGDRTIPAEFNPKYFHKKGMLAAARQGDDVNPAKASSSCQFYIVHGKIFSNEDLNSIEQRMEQQAKNVVFNMILMKPENKDFRDKIIALQNLGKMDSVQILIKQIEPEINAEYIKKPAKFTEEQRKAYTTVGGAPHLDGSYTVYGEVVEGLEVVDKIAAVKVDNNSRPLKDVMVRKVTILSNGIPATKTNKK